MSSHLQSIMKLLGWRARHGAVALACLAAPLTAAQAGEFSLRIERDPKGAVVQSIPLASWDFDAARGVLRATSRDGNRRCEGASTASGSHSLILDGRAYGVERIRKPRSVDTAITVRPVGPGVFPLCRAPAGPVAVQPRSTKGIAGLNLALDVIAEGSGVSRQVAVADRITYRPGSPASIEARVPDTLLCIERPGAAGSTFALTDDNGITSALAGIEAVEFDPAERVLGLDLSPGLLCFAPTSDGIPNLPAPRSSGDPVACDTQIDIGDWLFADNFEVTPPAPGSTPGTLEFALRLVQAPSIAEPEPLVYEYIVQNCGTTPLAGVTVREFWPGTNGSAQVRFDQTTAWEVCGESAAGCGSTIEGNAGYIETTLGSLAPVGEPGSRVVIRANRALAAGNAGERGRIDAVAIVNDGSKSIPAHVTGSWAVEVLETGNDAPVLTVSAGTLPTAQAPFEFAEDTGPVALTGADSFALRAEDADSGFDCGGGSCLSVVSSAPAVIGAGDVLATFVPNPDSTRGQLELTVTAKPDAFGPVTLTVAAVDADGGASNPVELALNVIPRNDPPIFRVGAGGLYPPAANRLETRSVQVTAPGYCDLVRASQESEFVLADETCPVQEWVENPTFPDNLLEYENWLTDVRAGPLEDGPVNVIVSLADDPDGVLSAFVYEEATGKLSYQLSGERGLVTLRVRVEDAEGVSTRIFVPIIVANTPPIVADPGPLAISEVFEGIVGDIDASDPDGDEVVGWSILSGDPGEAFTISPNGVLRVGDARPIDYEALPEGAKFLELVVAASDGIGAGERAVRIDVENADDEAPVLVAGVSRRVSIERGGSATLGDEALAATDADSAPRDVRYYVTGLDLPDATLEVGGTALAVGGFLTQTDIEEGRVTLRAAAGGTRLFGGVTFRLEDAAGNVNPNPVALAVEIL